MTDNFKEIGSLFGREGAGAGFAKQTDKESFTYAFAWPEGDTWATLTGYLNLDEQPEEYVRRAWYPCHAHRHRRTSARGDPSAG